MKLPNERYNYDMSNYYFSKKWQNKDNVKVTRLEKDLTVIPSYVPKEFVKAIKPAFPHGAVIKQFWSRVVMFKRITGW
ncbi:MAG TPA: hypothetical protein DCR67_05865, partial [Brevibacillus sp.]|nr:hypothetical protein [Brevibacillus sp.]